MVDSLDSVLMLYAYAAPSQDQSVKRFAMFFNSDKVDTGTEVTPEVPDEMDPNLPILHHDQVDPTVQSEDQPKSQKPVLANTGTDADVEATTSSGGIAPESGERRVLDAKANTISSLSITLTILSILVALRWVHCERPTHYDLWTLADSHVRV
jgi:high-affinity nickel-transport protein